MLPFGVTIPATVTAEIRNPGGTYELAFYNVRHQRVLPYKTNIKPQAQICIAPSYLTFTMKYTLSFLFLSGFPSFSWLFKLFYKY
jgi:hypothetical protein